jgi:predicted ATPase
MLTLRKLAVEGYKSIARADIELRDLNVVIGANGSGKSNLIGVFRLLDRVLSRNLQLYVAGEPDRLLHHERKVSPRLTLTLGFEDHSYGFTLLGLNDRLVFESETVRELVSKRVVQMQGPGRPESLFDDPGLTLMAFPEAALGLLRGLVVYHFQDASDMAPAKQSADLNDNRVLRADAANLAPYLYWLAQKHPVEFRQIEEHVRLVAPFFDGFVLAPSRLNANKIKLEWRQKGSDAYFDGYSLSDGTLRFICLATLLLQPAPPALILLDEPELGLHPYAIRILSEMLESAAKRSQVLLATQSVTLLDQFAPADVLVAENTGCTTVFKRLDEAALAQWLAEFSLGELWEKNVLGGRP